MRTTFAWLPTLFSILALVLLREVSRAESVPEFSLDHASANATHIVVVDASGTVSESWRGDLGKGERIPFAAAKEPLKVNEPRPRLPPDERPVVKEVSGKRRVLFLKRAKGETKWTPVGFLKEEEQFATVWIEKGECFAIYQFMNPGNGAQMLPLYMNEEQLRKTVAAVRGNSLP
jgi:hypothetical protein